MKTLSEAINGVEVAGAVYQKAATQTAGDVDAASLQAAKLAAAAAVVDGDKLQQRAGAVAFNLSLDELGQAVADARIPIEAAGPAAA